MTSEKLETLKASVAQVTEISSINPFPYIGCKFILLSNMTVKKKSENFLPEAFKSTCGVSLCLCKCIYKCMSPMEGNLSSSLWSHIAQIPPSSQNFGSQVKIVTVEGSVSELFSTPLPSLLSSVALCCSFRIHLPLTQEHHLMFIV